MSGDYKMEQLVNELMEITEILLVTKPDNKLYHELKQKYDNVKDKIKSERLRRPSGEEAGEFIENFVNTFDDSGKKEFVKYIVNKTHRTLNQSIIDMFFQAIYLQAENHLTGRYDARNEYATNICYKVKQFINDEVYFPMI